MQRPALGVVALLVGDPDEQVPAGVAEPALARGLLPQVAVVAVWCLAAIVVAVLVFRRVAWARILLVISSATAAGVCLLGTAMGGFVLVVPLIASVVATAFLLRPDVKTWFDAPAATPPR